MMRMHRKYRPFPASTGVMFICAVATALLACTSARRAPQDIPRHVTFRSSGDTVYGTTGDPVQVSVFSTLHSTRPWEESKPEPSYHVDFGDGTPFQRADRLRDRVSATHRYRQEGKYRAVIWAERQDSVIASDTIPIVLRDYVRPSATKRIAVSIAGIEMVLFNLVERPGKEDSTFLTRLRDFTYTYPYNNPERASFSLGWGSTQQWSTQNTRDERFAKHPQSLEDGFVSLSPDGSFIKNLQIIYKDRRKVDTGERYIYTGCRLQDIPLDSTATPTRDHALYKVRCSAAEIEQFVHQIYVSNSNQTEERTTRSWVLHTSAYSDVTITVEFFN